MARESGGRRGLGSGESGDVEKRGKRDVRSLGGSGSFILGGDFDVYRYLLLGF